MEPLQLSVVILFSWKLADAFIGQLKIVGLGVYRIFHLFYVFQWFYVDVEVLKNIIRNISYIYFKFMTLFIYMILIIIILLYW